MNLYMAGTESIPELMLQSEQTTEAYTKLMEALQDFAGVKVQEKRNSLWLVSGKDAFLGVQTRKAGIRITLVLDRELKHPRIVKSEQVSKSRFHNELDFDASATIDKELKAWLKEAYDVQHR